MNDDALAHWGRGVLLGQKQTVCSSYVVCQLCMKGSYELKVMILLKHFLILLNVKYTK